MGSSDGPKVKASQVQLDGGFRTIPGYTAGLTDDQRPHFVSSGRLDLTAAVTEQTAASSLIPYTGTMMAVMARVRTSPDIQAIVKVGKIGATSSISWFAEITIPAAATIGNVYQGLILNAAVAQFDVITFSGDGGASNTANVDVVAVVAPRA